MHVEFSEEISGKAENEIGIWHRLSTPVTADVVVIRHSESMA
jgi:hypothetical protein